MYWPLKTLVTTKRSLFECDSLWLGKYTFQKVTHTQAVLTRQFCGFGITTIFHVLHLFHVNNAQDRQGDWLLVQCIVCESLTYR